LIHITYSFIILFSDPCDFRYNKTGNKSIAGDPASAEPISFPFDDHPARARRGGKAISILYDARIFFGERAGSAGKRRLRENRII